MKISLCNEVLRELEFGEQCRYIADLGYDGIEIAPFTLSDEPHRIAADTRAQIRRQAEEAGLSITGLHWLLLTPEGLSVTSADSGVRSRTVGVMKGLVELCSDLGGKTLIHGSPQQRMVEDGDFESARERAVEIFSEVAAVAQDADVTYCIEPLSKAETNFINNLEEASQLVDRVGNPAFKTMLDTKAVFTGESQSVLKLIDRWLPTGRIGQIHVNEANLRGPGQGQNAFTPIFAALKRHGYAGVVSVEPFDYFPDACGSAARAIGYLRGILEALNYQEEKVDADSGSVSD